MRLLRSHREHFTLWLHHHLQANYLVQDQTTVVNEIVHEFSSEASPGRFLYNWYDGKSSDASDVSLTDDQKWARLEASYGKLKGKHVTVLTLLYNEVVTELYERRWHSGSFVNPSLIPCRLRPNPTNTQAASLDDDAKVSFEAQPQCSLLTRLPAEIRSLIYGHAVLEEDRATFVAGKVAQVPAIMVAPRSADIVQALERVVTHSMHQRRPPPFTFTCKQIRYETLAMFFAGNVFVLPTSENSELKSVDVWLRAIGDRNIGYLRNVVIECHEESSGARHLVSIGIDLQDMTAAINRKEVPETRKPGGVVKRTRALQRSMHKAVKEKLDEMRLEDPRNVTDRRKLLSLIATVRLNLDPTKTNQRKFFRENGMQHGVDGIMDRLLS